MASCLVRRMPKSEALRDAKLWLRGHTDGHAETPACHDRGLLLILWVRRPAYLNIVLIAPQLVCAWTGESGQPTGKAPTRPHSGLLSSAQGESSSSL